MTRVPERPLPLFGAFRSLPEALPNASFRSFRRNPCRTVLRKVPPVPEASPKVVSPKASFDTPSKQTLRSFLRNAPRDPKVKPKVSPEAFFGLSFGTCHVSRRARPSENPSSGSRPNLPSVPESLNSKLPPGALRAATRPGAHAETLSGRLPGHPPSVFRTRQVSPSAPSGKSSRKPRMRCVPECRVRFPRMPPVAPRVPSRETTRTPPGSPANHPRKTLPGTRRNSSLNRKNPKPIFTVSF